MLNRDKAKPEEGLTYTSPGAELVLESRDHPKALTSSRGSPYGAGRAPPGSNSSSGQRAMPKARKGVCFKWHDVLHGGAPAAAGASGCYGICQMKSKNHHFHILFNVMIPQEDFTVM